MSGTPPLQPPLRLAGDFPRLESFRAITERDELLYELAACTTLHIADLGTPAALGFVSVLLGGWPLRRGDRSETAPLRSMSDRFAHLAASHGATRADVADAWDVSELGAKKKIRRGRELRPAGETLAIEPVLGEEGIAILEEAGVDTGGRVILPKPLDPSERVRPRLGVVQVGDVPPEQSDVELQRMAMALYASLRRNG